MSSLPPLQPRLWQAVLALLVGMLASFHSWQNDQLAQALLAQGSVLHGEVTAIRDVSASRLCSVSYQFSSPYGIRVARASLSHAICSPLNRQLQRGENPSVEILWLSNGDFSLKADARERVEKSGGWPVYALRFFLVTTTVYILALVIGAYSRKTQ